MPLLGTLILKNSCNGFYFYELTLIIICRHFSRTLILPADDGQIGQVSAPMVTLLNSFTGYMCLNNTAMPFNQVYLSLHSICEKPDKLPFLPHCLRLSSLIFPPSSLLLFMSCTCMEALYCYSDIQAAATP